MSLISRNKWLAETVIFVDGLFGCGKTMLSPMVASMERVELLSYAYEIEHYCSLFHLGKIDQDAAEALVRIQTDLKIYNTMMGRDVNFRPSDLSSIFKDHDPNRYLKRIFSAGDAEIPDIISRKRPILNFAVHNLLAFSEPLWRALGERCVFIEVVRHPLYMVRQQALNFQNLLENARDFTIYFSYQGRELPYYVYGWEETYLKSTPMERAVYLIDHLTSVVGTTREKLRAEYKAKILTIPFEPFVLDPLPWLNKLADIAGTQITDATLRVMEEQNVPREKVAQGVDLDIYRRCGWVPPTEGASEKDELFIRRGDVALNANSQAMEVLDNLCNEYENSYWSP